MSNEEAPWLYGIIPAKEIPYYAAIVDEKTDTKIYEESWEVEQEVGMILIEKGYSDDQIIAFLDTELDEVVCFRLLHKYRDMRKEGIAKRMKQAGVSKEQILEITGMKLD